MTLNMDGQLLETPRDGVVAVQIGNMRATLPLEQLRPLKKVEAAAVERKAAMQPAGQHRAWARSPCASRCTSRPN